MKHYPYLVQVEQTFEDIVDPPPSLYLFETYGEARSFYEDKIKNRTKAILYSLSLEMSNTD